MNKKPKEISILDQRRSYQINIMLGGMKHTYPEIRKAVLRMDEDFMTIVQLSNFLKFVPDAEEVKRSGASSGCFFAGLMFLIMTFQSNA